MAELDVRQGLVDRGCLYLETGAQFVGISGKHLTGYCNIDPALTDVGFMSDVSQTLVEPYLDADVEAVLSPAIGAIPIGHLAAFHLMQATGREGVAAVWADKVKPRGFVLERSGFGDAVQGRRVVILEDMINQMFSAGELVRIARDEEAEVLGVGSVAANRGVTAEALGVPRFEALCEVAYDAFTPEECADHGPCSEGWKIVVDEALGHGAEWRDEHPDYAGGFVNLVKA